MHLLLQGMIPVGRADKLVQGAGHADGIPPCVKARQQALVQRHVDATTVAAHQGRRFTRKHLPPREYTGLVMDHQLQRMRQL
ncbi:MAG: hypothetical protein K5880_04270 [Hydrogenophaga sp.]|nr:hypothetical protein [Hydrogenophaga sp.]